MRSHHQVEARARHADQVLISADGPTAMSRRRCGLCRQQVSWQRHGYEDVRGRTHCIGRTLAVAERLNPFDHLRGLRGADLATGIVLEPALIPVRAVLWAIRGCHAATTWILGRTTP